MLVVIAILLGLVLLALLNRRAATLTVIAGLGCTSFLFVLGLGAALGIGAAAWLNNDGVGPVLAAVCGFGVAALTIVYGLRAFRWLFDYVLFPNTAREYRERREEREALERAIFSEREQDARDVPLMDP